MVEAALKNDCRYQIFKRISKFTQLALSLIEILLRIEWIKRKSQFFQPLTNTESSIDLNIQMPFTREIIREQISL